MQEADEPSEGKKKAVHRAQEESWSAARQRARAHVWFIPWMSVYSVAVLTVYYGSCGCF